MTIRLILCLLLLTRVAGLTCNCPENSMLEKGMQNWLGTAGFELTLDTAAPDKLPHHLNNIDLAVIGLPPLENPCNCSAIYAQVLLSRDHRDGYVVEHDADTLEAKGVDFRWWDYDRWDSYDPSAWTAPPAGRYFGQVLPFDELSKQPPFMMAHPASCFKIMVATGVLLALNDGRLTLEQPAIVNITAFADVTSPRYIWNGTVDTAVRAMITVSDNSATTALIDLLHTVGVLHADWESPNNELAQLFRSLGLHLLRLEGTQPGGYWGPPTVEQRNRSSDYDTTGFYHMGAFDVSKLLWLLCPFANVPPSFSVQTATGLKPVDGNFVSQRWKTYLFSVLKDQAYHEVLSSTAICGRPGRRPGIPSLEPSQWIFPPGNQVIVEGGVMSEDVTPCQQTADSLFFHKTGSTYTFGSNSGVVMRSDQRQYIVSIVGNLGTRFIDRDLASYGNPCSAISVCYTQNIPHIGLQLHTFLSSLSWT